MPDEDLSKEWVPPIVETRTVLIEVPEGDNLDSLYLGVPYTIPTRRVVFGPPQEVRTRSVVFHVTPINETPLDEENIELSTSTTQSDGYEGGSSTNEPSLDSPEFLELPRILPTTKVYFGEAQTVPTRSVVFDVPLDEPQEPCHEVHPQRDSTLSSLPSPPSPPQQPSPLQPPSPPTEPPPTEPPRRRTRRRRCVIS